MKIRTAQKFGKSFWPLTELLASGFLLASKFLRIFRELHRIFLSTSFAYPYSYVRDIEDARPKPKTIMKLPMNIEIIFIKKCCLYRSRRDRSLSFALFCFSFIFKILRVILWKLPMALGSRVHHFFSHFYGMLYF